jgi:hypothetical protein
MEEMEDLLSRAEFRERIFSREGSLCAVCFNQAVDAHHIMERRLWPDGGYYIANGAAVCELHHLQAESTELSCDEIREAVDIKKAILPPHLYRDQPYDKWGNEILPNGTRLRGELFFDESVQKALKPVLHLFTNRVKYPRTYHLPWSPGILKDDRAWGCETLDWFSENKPEVVVTAKMDGENTTMYRDYMHARSIEYESHESRNRAKAFQARIGCDIPEDWRLCLENLYAMHNIHYRNLPAFEMLFSIWNDKNECLSWDETETWSKLIGVPLVPILYRGPWDQQAIKATYSAMYDGDECEGYVVRVADQFHYREFRTKVGKYVRAGHVQNHGRKFQDVTPNFLRKGSYQR